MNFPKLENEDFWAVMDEWSKLMGPEDDERFRRHMGISKPTVERYKLHQSAPHPYGAHPMAEWMKKEMDKKREEIKAIYDSR